MQRLTIEQLEKYNASTPREVVATPKPVEEEEEELPCAGNCAI